MKCLKCGHENAPEAKFCVGCGAVMPGPVSMAATQAITPPITAASGSPRRTAKFIVLGAVLLIVAVCAFAAWKIFGHGGGSAASFPTMEPPKPPAAEAPKDEAPATPAMPPPQPDAQAPSPAVATPPAAAEPAKAPEPPPAEPPKAEPMTPPPAAVAPKPPAPKPAPKAAPAVKPAAKAAAHEPPRPDRWAMMADEMEACKRQAFLTRVVCEQKVGQKYCEGYWGLVPQCGGQAKP